MKLYYSPGACSQAPHILLHELELDHDAAKVDLKSHTLADGSDYYAVNPKGSVPAIGLDNGEVLTENAVVLQYLADTAGNRDVLGPTGDLRRYRALEWVNFITTELHKGFGPLFSSASDEVKSFARDGVGKKLDYIDERLGDGPFLMGDKLTLPDPYLFVITGWAEKFFGLDHWPSLKAFRARMMQRESVRHVLRFEGLLKPDSAA